MESKNYALQNRVQTRAARKLKLSASRKCSQSNMDCINFEGQIENVTSENDVQSAQ